MWRGTKNRRHVTHCEQEVTRQGGGGGGGGRRGVEVGEGARLMICWLSFCTMEDDEGVLFAKFCRSCGGCSGVQQQHPHRTLSKKRLIKLNFFQGYLSVIIYKFVATDYRLMLTIISRIFSTVFNWRIPGRHKININLVIQFVLANSAPCPLYPHQQLYWSRKIAPEFAEGGFSLSLSFSVHISPSLIE